MVIEPSAVLAILQDEPERRAFNELVESAPTRAMSVASWVEASMVLQSRFGAEGMSQRPIKTLTVTFEDDVGNVVSEVLQAGQHIVEAGSIIFQDCYESGDTTAWSATVH